MKKLITAITVSAISAALLLAGCGNRTVSTQTSAQTEESSTQSQTAEETTRRSVTQEVTTAGSSGDDTVSAGAEVTTEKVSDTDSSDSVFTDRDLTQTADTSDAEYYTAKSGTTVTITEAGVYVFSGSAENYTIKVDADSDAKVQIVLDGLTVTNDDFPVIYVVSADKVFVTTTDSTNTLKVTGTFTSDGTTNTDAVIFAKDDLVLNGTGTLVITSSAHGISAKDDLKITGGTYVITSVKHCIEVNDSLYISGGDFTLTSSSKDGINCGDDDDDTTGEVYIFGGTFVISSASDGIQAQAKLEIDGGTFDITSAEGLEATYVVINDGTINISASDDGINASAKSSAYSVLIEFNGGSTTIVMGSGDTDAVDANGSIVVNDGYINITAQSAFDYDQSGVINGGTVIVNGTQITVMTNQFGGGMGGFGGFGGGGRR